MLPQNKFYTQDASPAPINLGAPVCSIIIPAYRAEKTLAQTLDSVLAQTMLNWETIIIVDGVFTGDATLQIAENYANKDQRFHVLVNNKNMGTALSRNRGVNQARAPWIAFLDSDDQFHPQKLQRQLALAARIGSSFLCSSYKVINSAEKTIRLVKALEHITRADLIQRNVIGCSTVMLRRELALKYPMRDNVIHEDYLCWLECLQECECRGCAEPLVDVRLTPGSRNSDKLRSVQGVWRIYRDFIHCGLLSALVLMFNYGIRLIGEYLRRTSS